MPILTFYTFVFYLVDNAVEVFRVSQLNYSAGTSNYAPQKSRLHQHNKLSLYSSVGGQRSRW